ncbi:MAG: UDP-N-acetylmuramyl-tripeptide synthetase, partial [Clostridia bacterium]|nr:UDP-N-acetylmuramyl-tripeptide synthetase [Clostridia bacterium]
MQIKDILKNVKAEYNGDLSVEITDVTCDSREVKKGSLFFCITGYKSDGHSFAADAVKSGAAALMVSRRLDIDIPQILVEDERAAMATISANFFGKPFESMTMIGVTGTNGKTTTTYLCANVAKSLGKKVGIIGTICNYIMDEEISSKNTTPESVELMRLLALMREKGVEVVFMEVSSHSLFLKRVYGITFDVGVFTNLTQDHLDFHLTMENYLRAKCRLFDMTSRRGRKQNKTVAINIDDTASGEILKHCTCDKITYGLNSSANLRGAELDIRADGMKFKICGEFGAMN